MFRQLYPVHTASWIKLSVHLVRWIASTSVALIGYTSTMPQPGDECTTGVLVLTIGLTYALPMLGWICTLVAMKFCHLNREDMVAVQKCIAEKKEALKQQKAQ